MVDNTRLIIQRRRIYKREQGKCFYCDKWMAFVDSTRDHIIPKSQGGMNKYDNVVLSCRECNNARGDAPADSFLILKLTGKNINVRQI